MHLRRPQQIPSCATNVVVSATLGERLWCGGDTESSPPGRRQKPHARGSQTGRGSDAAALKKFGLMPRRQPNILPSAGVSAALVRFIFCRKLAICRPSSILGAFFVGGVYPNLFCATVVPNPPGS